MKLVILSIALAIASATADVSHILKGGKDERSAAILAQELDVAPEGAYQWAFETENGISAKANGEIVNPNAENPSQIASGAASWTAPDGQVVSFQYVADENGYQPQGAFIPTPPPIPVAILRALEYIRDHPPKPEEARPQKKLI